MDFIESHARYMYRILGHGKDEYTLVHCQKQGEKYPTDRRLVNNEEDFIKWCKEYNGKGNCYVGQNARDSKELVTTVRVLTLDLDPIREKGEAATEIQLDTTIRAARCINQQVKDGIYAISGNGCLVIYRIEPRRDFLNCKCTAKNLQEVSRRIIKDFEQEVRIDATHDNERLAKIMGTISTKGNPELWRNARFLDLQAVQRSRCSEVFERIEEYKSKYRIQPTLSSGSRVVGDVFKSRSEADFAVALRCKRLGYGKDRTLEILRSNPYGKQEDGTEQYFQYTINKVFDGSQEEQANNQSRIIGFTEEEFKKYVTRIDSSDSSKPSIELPTGYRGLDEGGFSPTRGQLFVVGARTGIGKTSLCLNLSSNLHECGKRVLIFSTELSPGGIWDRVFCLRNGIHWNKFQTKTLSEEEKGRIKEDYQRLAQGNIIICDCAEPNIEIIRKEVSITKPDLFIVDHIQHTVSSGDNRYGELSRLIKQLRSLARELNVGCIVVSQLNRLAEYEKPTLAHLKECGTIEEEATVVLLLSKYKSTDTSQSLVPVNVEIAKPRGGGEFRMFFERNTGKYNEV